jgi:hypothetical protein
MKLPFCYKITRVRVLGENVSENAKTFFVLALNEARALNWFWQTQCADDEIVSDIESRWRHRRL